VASDQLGVRLWLLVGPEPSQGQLGSPQFNAHHNRCRLTLMQVKLAAENDQQYPSHAITALRQGSFSKFPEIVAFGKKLSHSFQSAQVTALNCHSAAYTHLCTAGPSTLRMELVCGKVRRKLICCRVSCDYGLQRRRRFVSRTFEREIEWRFGCASRSCRGGEAARQQRFQLSGALFCDILMFS
jgi:hypothetical protein